MIQESSQRWLQPRSGIFACDRDGHRGHRTSPNDASPWAAMTAESLDEFLACFPGLVFISDEDGRLLRCSDALTARFGERLGAGATLSALVAPDDRVVVEAFLVELARTEAPVTCTFRVPETNAADTVVR